MSSGFFGGGDMNGIRLLLPELAVRISFAIIAVFHLLVIWNMAVHRLVRLLLLGLGAVREYEKGSPARHGAHGRSLSPEEIPLRTILLGYAHRADTMPHRCGNLCVAVLKL